MKLTFNLLLKYGISSIHHRRSVPYQFVASHLLEITWWGTPKAKGKVHPRTAQEGPKGKLMYSYTLSLTSALYGVGGQCHAPAALIPGKTRYPLYRRLFGYGRVRRISPHRHSIPGSSSL